MMEINQQKEESSHHREMQMDRHKLRVELDKKHFEQNLAAVKQVVGEEEKGVFVIEPMEE